eukprot:s1269_g13.t1
MTCAVCVHPTTGIDCSQPGNLKREYFDAFCVWSCYPPLQSHVHMLAYESKGMKVMQIGQDDGAGFRSEHPHFDALRDSLFSDQNPVRVSRRPKLANCVGGN